MNAELNKLRQLPQPFQEACERSVGINLAELARMERKINRAWVWWLFSMLTVVFSACIIGTNRPLTLPQVNALISLPILAFLVTGARAVILTERSDHKVTTDQRKKLKVIVSSAEAIEGLFKEKDRCWKLDPRLIKHHCEDALKNLAMDVELIDASNLCSRLKDRFKAPIMGEFNQIHQNMAHVCICNEPFGKYFPPPRI